MLEVTYSQRKSNYCREYWPYSSEQSPHKLPNRQINKQQWPNKKEIFQLCWNTFSTFHQVQFVRQYSEVRHLLILDEVITDLDHRQPKVKFKENIIFNVNTESWNNVGHRSEYDTLGLTDIKWGVSSRWSFRPNSKWSSIETVTIGKTHSTLILIYPLFVCSLNMSCTSTSKRAWTMWFR